MNNEELKVIIDNLLSWIGEILNEEDYKEFLETHLTEEQRKELED